LPTVFCLAAGQTAVLDFLLAAGIVRDQLRDWGELDRVMILPRRWQLSNADRII
jgi:hypothetical protein